MISTKFAMEYIVMKLDELLVIIYSSWVLVYKTVCVVMPKF